MATRQYIGARYVTKIYENSLDPSSAEWESSVNYEPLTLVTFNNGSYLSKKPVPASVGNPADNPNFWVQTGFYNGQIAYIQQQIDDMQDGSIPGSIQDQINTNTTNISTLLGNMPRSALREFNKLNILCIGDSFGDTQLYEQGIGYGSWVVEFGNIVTVANLYNYCKNSSGYCSGQSNPYKTLAMTAAGDIDPTSINIVIVQGGLNDITSGLSDGNSNVADITDTFDYIKATFTNADVLIVPMTWSATFNGREPFVMGFPKWAMNITKQAMYHGFRVAQSPWMWNIGDTGFLGPDNFHPSISGAKNIAGHIIASILGNDTVSYGVTIGNVGVKQYIQWTFNNASVHMEGQLVNVQLNSSKQIVQNIPECLVPSKEPSLYRLLPYVTVIANGVPVSCMAGYVIDAYPAMTAKIIFYGGDLNSMSVGDTVSLYFHDDFVA